MTMALDLSGKRFGRWSVLKRAESLNGDSAWFCICDCGEKRTVRGSWLNRRRSCSCGCLVREISIRTNTTHGMNGTKEYKAWGSMKQRCLNPRNKSYPSYGGAGITICETWKTSFEAFFVDMGSSPSQAHSVDRINGRRGYSPDNCRWATAKEQIRNRCSNTMITAFGETKLLCEWVEDHRCSVTSSAITKRLQAGLPAEDAIVLPNKRKAICQTGALRAPMQMGLSV